MIRPSLKFEFSEAPLDVSEAASFLYTERAGGVNLFIGVTRQWTGNKETLKLTYECYLPMALKEMEKLLLESCEKWPVEKVYMIHRLGEVPLGRPSVIIGVATPHRSEAFEACKFLIDELKIRVPIWKRENYADGSEEWVSPV